MSKSFVCSLPLSEFGLWKKMKNGRGLINFELEITARCNNKCRHCYINLPAEDKAAKEKELSLDEIKRIADEAVSLGALGCLITGGEPLLREDFFDIYLFLKKKGLLISVFTNATLIRKEHISLFKKYPPRDIEVTVHGITKESYEKVTRKSGSFDAFMRGVNLLVENRIYVRFKTMVLRSNIHEFSEIACFCRKKSRDYFHFDLFLHLRYDGNKIRNEEIKSERLSPKEIVAIEQIDFERFETLEKKCNKLIIPELASLKCNHLFYCGTGTHSFSLSYDGLFRLCSALWHPDCIYDLRKGTLSEAWKNFVPIVRDMRSNRKEFLDNCHVCPLIKLCMGCPAYSHLEAGSLDTPVDYFCKVAHARAEVLGIRGR